MSDEYYSRGDIVYIERSQPAEVGSEMHGARPGVIVSNDILNASSPVVSVVYLTTQPKKGYANTRYSKKHGANINRDMRTNQHSFQASH